MPTPARSHLPMKDFIAASGVLDDEANSAHNNDADVALLRLPAPSLRGTFAKAYGLLAQLVSQIGWDELLKCRSQVFVMEEEYRMQKANDPVSAGAAGGVGSPQPVPNGVVHANGAGPEDDETAKDSFGPLTVEDGADDNASTTAIRDIATPTIKIARGSTDNLDPAPPESPIPTIKVSTESDGERERKAVSDYEASTDLEKPQQSVLPTEEAQSATVPTTTELPPTNGTAVATPGSFNNKRLCERWLDNLFMVLYEVGLFRHVSLHFEDRLICSFASRIFVCTQSGEQK